MENQEVVLTSRERVERLAGGGFFSLAGFSLVALMTGRHSPAWTAFFLLPVFSAALACFLQVRSHLCAFRGLSNATVRNKILILWLQAFTGALLIAGLVFFILLKGPY